MTEIVKSDFDAVGQELLDDPSVDFKTALARLVTTSPAARSTTSKMPAASRMSENLIRAVNKLPRVFRRTALPGERRTLTPNELDGIGEERAVLDQLLSALKKRKEEINEAYSTHCDVVAEQRGLVDKKTSPRDSKGHYLVASPGNPERVPLENHPYAFSRERTSDTMEFPHDRLMKAYQNGDLTRGDYLACTTPYSGRSIDEDKIRKMLVSLRHRDRAGKIIRLVGQVKPGTNSIHMRDC